MLKYILIGFVLVTMFCGCASEQKPNYSDDKIVTVLKDMLLAEAASTKVNGDKRDSLIRLYYEQIYQIHQIDSALFAKDLELVGEKPSHSITIYERIEKELEEEQRSDKKEK